MKSDIKILHKVTDVPPELNAIRDTLDHLASQYYDYAYAMMREGHDVNAVYDAVRLYRDTLARLRRIETHKRLA